MTFFEMIALGFLQEILEFFPISSSFFIGQLFAEEYNFLLHGFCGICTMFYFLPRIKSFLNFRCLLFFCTFVVSIVCHVLLCKSMLFPLGLCIILILLKFINQNIFNHYGLYLLGYICLIFLSFLDYAPTNMSVLVHLSSILLLVLGLFFNDTNKFINYHVMDALVLGGLIFISGKFCTSRLGLLIIYLSLRRYDLKNSVQLSFLLSGIVNMICLIYVITFPYHHVDISMKGALLPMGKDIFYLAFGAMLGIPIAMQIMNVFEKFPTILIIISCLFRIILILRI